MTNRNLQTGSLVITDDDRYGFIILSERGIDSYNCLNCIDFETEKYCRGHFINADVHKATKEERHKYFRAVLKNEGIKVPKNYSGKDAVLAGTIVVLDDHIMGILASDQRRDSIKERYVAAQIEIPTGIRLKHRVPALRYRIATTAETIIYYAYIWKLVMNQKLEEDD